MELQRQLLIRRMQKWLKKTTTVTYDECRNDEIGRHRSIQLVEDKVAMIGVLSSRANMEHASVISEGRSKDSKKKNFRVSTVSKSRTSERLRIKKNRKEIATRNKIVSQIRHRAVELSQVQIHYENPSHKMLFLARLGLSPVSGAHIPPYLKLERVLPEKVNVLKLSNEICLPDTNDSENENSSGIGTQSSDTDDESIQWIDSDDDPDLDLEVVICPVDIPEFFEELYIKKPKLVHQEKKGSVSALSASNSRQFVSSSSEGFSDDKNSSPQCNRKKSDRKLIRIPAKRKILPINLNSVYSHTLPNSNIYVSTIPEVALIDLTQDDDKDSLDDIRQRLLVLDTEVECLD